MKYDIETLPLNFSNSFQVPIWADFDDYDKTPDATFAWFRNYQYCPAQSPEEEIEKNRAIQYQYHLKLINRLGLPYGSPKPPEVLEEIAQYILDNKKSKWDKKRDKQRAKDEKHRAFQSKYIVGKRPEDQDYMKTETIKT